MPIYEYECIKCGHKQEALQKTSDSPLTKCSFCDGVLSKLVSQSSFHLKGSGWYVTDYRKNQTKAKSDIKPKVSNQKKEKKTETKQKLE